MKDRPPVTQDVYRRDTCRLCDSSNLELCVPMKESPIADAFIPASRLGQSQKLYPLDLYLCNNCGHVQNLDVVNPEILFRDYLYTTSSSASLVEHFRNYALNVIADLAIPKNSLILEIGSNDGSLLKFFKAEEMRVLGIDPAREIASQATHKGIETLPEFFNFKLAAQIHKKYGCASLVCANNVFAHTDDLADIVHGVREILADDGVFVFEVSYLIDIVDEFLFDTVYHEHVSYHSIAPLAQFFERMNMQLFDVQRIASKGGSVRCFAQRLDKGQRQLKQNVNDFIMQEKHRGFDKITLYQEYANQINQRKIELNDFLDQAIAQGKMIAGYGASTTTTTLLWNFELTRKLAFIVDDNQVKHGRYCPACHIPVFPSDELYLRQPDYVVLLAWQYAGVIAKKHERYTKEIGNFIIPLKELKVV